MRLVRSHGTAWLDRSASGFLELLWLVTAPARWNCGRVEASTRWSCRSEMPKCAVCRVNIGKGDGRDIGLRHWVVFGLHLGRMPEPVPSDAKRLPSGKLCSECDKALDMESRGADTEDVEALVLQFPRDVMVNPARANPLLRAPQLSDDFFPGIRAKAKNVVDAARDRMKDFVCRTVTEKPVDAVAWLWKSHREQEGWKLSPTCTLPLVLRSR